MRRAARWRGVLVLNYHRVGARDGQPWDHGLWNADAAAFEAQVGVLSRSADIVAARDVPEIVRRSARGRHVLLTFDDGYRDNYEVAYPILRRYGAPAAFFVATGLLDRPRAPWWDEIAWMVRNSSREALEDLPRRGSRLSLHGDEIEATINILVACYKGLPGNETDRYLEQIAAATGAGRCAESAGAELWMSWDMVREMRDGGMDIGGHTDTHPILARLDATAQHREIGRCSLRLSEELGAPMRWFAYPVGARDSFTPTTQQILGEHGVEMAFSFYGGFAGFDDWSALDVPRNHVGYGTTPALLEAMIGLPMLFARP